MKKTEKKSADKADKWYGAWHPTNQGYLWHWLILILVAGSLVTVFWMKNQSSNTALNPNLSSADEVASIEQRITPLTQELLDAAHALKKADSTQRIELISQIRNLANSRNKLMTELAEKDSKAVKRHVIAPGLQKKLPNEVQGMLETEVTLEGTLEWLRSDDFDRNTGKDEFFVNKSGKKTQVKMTDFPKAKPGDRVKIVAVELDNNNTVASSNDVTVLASAEIAATSVNKKVAVILFKQSNAKSNPPSENEVRTNVFTGDRSVNSYYKENSFGQWSLTGHLRTDGDIFGTYTISLPGEGCNTGGWAAEAEAAAAANGFVRTNYDNIIYIFPFNTSFCGWGGLAYLNQRPGQSWINQFTVGIVAHELGHNYAWHHASSLTCTNSSGVKVTISNNCTTAEYGDPHNVMGSTGGQKHVGVYNKGTNVGVGPNWLSASNMATADPSITPSAEYVLTPMEQGGSGLKSLRLQKDYMVNGSLRNGYYYIEYRQPSTFDNYASTDPMVNGVVVRLAPDYSGIVQSQLLDMTPSTTNGNDYSLTSGKSFVDNEKGIKITVLSTSASEARVRVEAVSSVCVQSNPTLTLTPTTQTGVAGSTLTYNLTIKNNDSEVCPARSMVVNPTLPAGWSQTPASLTENLLPGGSVTRSVLVTSDILALPDGYNVIESTSGAQASSVYVVTDSTSNPGADTIAPKSVITTPANNSSVAKKGKMQIRTTASDNVKVTKMNVYLDGTLLKTCTNVTICDTSASLNNMSPGNHTVKAESFDAAGNTGSATSVIVKQ